MVLELMLIGQLMVTSYTNAVDETDDSPDWTSIGEHVHVGGCAVSQDLLRSGAVKYHDYIYVDGFGLCQVNDTMHKRIIEGVDLFVMSKKEEPKVGKSIHKVYKLKVPLGKYKRLYHDI